MYLAADVWSPRYESRFFTVKLEGYERRLTRSDDDGHSTTTTGGTTADSRALLSVKGNSSFPAYYYQVVVCSGSMRRVVPRRYSHFKWLATQLLQSDPNHDDAILSLPPGTCPWQPQDDKFASRRMRDLARFLDEILQKPSNANHEAVVAFLEL
jgi:hypothetical protein